MSNAEPPKGSTPIKKKSSNANASAQVTPSTTAEPGKGRSQLLAELARDMGDEIAPPMEFSQFLETFMPLAEEPAFAVQLKKNYFLGMPTAFGVGRWKKWRAACRGGGGDENEDEDEDDRDEPPEKENVKEIVNRDYDSEDEHDNENEEGGNIDEGMEQDVSSELGDMEEEGEDDLDSDEAPLGYIKNTKEAAMCKKLITLIRPLLPSCFVTDSSTKADRDSNKDKRWRPDIAVYSRQNTMGLAKKPTQFENLQLPIEVKTKRTTKAFRDKAPYLANDKGCLTRGQIFMVLTEMMNRQHRTHGFMVLIEDPFFRVVRVDRAGVIVTEGINMRTNPEPVFKFFSRFNALSPQARGVDPSVRLANPKETEIAKERLKAWTPKYTRSAFVIQVPLDAVGATREVYSWGALVEPESMTGRCTRGSPVWDPLSQRVCFLKDTWRCCADGMLKESDLIRELHGAGVSRIPVILAGDDVHGPFQTTRTQEFLPSLDKRCHHRLLEAFIPKSIKDAETPKGMMRAIYDAFQAHKEAYLKVGILHRDISDNNVMIDDSGRGILTDWELAIRVKKDGDFLKLSPRQRYRTGTWDFISARLLGALGRRHELGDDLESFLWLVLHLAIRKLEYRHPCSDPPALILKEIFEENIWVPAQRAYRGGKEKQLIILRPFHPMRRTEFTGNTALQEWRTTVLDRLFAVFPVQEANDEHGEEFASAEPRHLETQRIMEAAFERGLGSNDWSGPFKAVPGPTRPINPLHTAALIKQEARQNKRDKPHDDDQPKASGSLSKKQKHGSSLQVLPPAPRRQSPRTSSNGETRVSGPSTSQSSDHRSPKRSNTTSLGSHGQ